MNEKELLTKEKIYNDYKDDYVRSLSTFSILIALFALLGLIGCWGSKEAKIIIVFTYISATTIAVIIGAWVWETYRLVLAKRYKFTVKKVELESKKQTVYRYFLFDKARKDLRDSWMFYFVNGEKIELDAHIPRQWFDMFAYGGESVFNSSDPRDLFYVVKMGKGKRLDYIYNTKLFEYRE